MLDTIAREVLRIESDGTADSTVVVVKDQNGEVVGAARRVSDESPQRSDRFIARIELPERGPVVVYEVEGHVLTIDVREMEIKIPERGSPTSRASPRAPRRRHARERAFPFWLGEHED